MSLYTSWVSGMFEYECMSLVEITRQLARWYNVDFVFESKEFEFHSFTGVALRNQTLGETLSNIAKTTNVEFEISGRTIFVKRR